MSQKEDEWICEFETPVPSMEQRVGDGRGLYVNANIAYSYFKNIQYLYPELRFEDGQNILLYRTRCPQDFFGRFYKLYRLKRGNRICFFIPIPKFCRAALAKQRKRMMYKYKIYFDEEGDAIIKIIPFGGQ